MSSTKHLNSVFFSTICPNPMCRSKAYGLRSSCRGILFWLQEALNINKSSKSSPSQCLRNAKQHLNKPEASVRPVEIWGECLFAHLH
ncbi:hypothetical protein XENTR_v10024108 [Xenopus tropicalis]|nr:hypothetical protein XENTR_v10024108 [Xenopus tropicalis]